MMNGAHRVARTPIYNVDRRPSVHYLEFVGVYLERYTHLGPVGQDFAFFQMHIQLDDFSHAQVTQGLARCFDRDGCGALP